MPGLSVGAMADSFAFEGALPSARGGFGALWPIVVGFYQITVAVAQFEIGTGQNTGDAELGQGGAERTKHYRLRRAPADDESTNQNVVACPDLPSRGNVTKAAARSAQVINFEERDSASSGLLRVGRRPDNRGVIPRIKSDQERGLDAIGGRDGNWKLFLRCCW